MSEERYFIYAAIKAENQFLKLDEKYIVHSQLYIGELPEIKGKEDTVISRRRLRTQNAQQT